MAEFDDENDDVNPGNRAEDADAAAREDAERARELAADAERRRIRRSNDRDQQLEREGKVAPHNQGYDRAVEGATAGSEGAGTPREDDTTD